MITDDGEKWHYLAARSVPALLRGKTVFINIAYLIDL